MSVLWGVLFHASGGFASGSFYLPYNKVKGWAWESYWLIGGLFSWVAAPWILGLLTVPTLIEVLKQSPSKTLWWN
ncbi:L-rhamnose/proton symporter RhaT [Spirosoma luteum]|uniref:L-rhamnose/proton symporter RhaT n=1 Tax=Spirosoma luteum TaxID=431553 RepID=UPI0003768508|nr:L-rhamnose/proton symporter RhaT [Spirosoma luteum]